MFKVCTTSNIHSRVIISNDRNIAKVQKVGNSLIILGRKNEKKKVQRIDIHAFMFQGNSKKISNNFSKFGVPTPS